MQIFRDIKNILIVYLISSAIWGLAIFSLIIFHKYGHHFADTLNVIRDISNNKKKVIEQINKMDAVINYLKYDLKLNTVDAYSEISFFHRLDDIKANMKDVSITIAKFEEAGGEKILPTQIAVPVKNYRTLVDYAGYIESFSVPPIFRVKGFSISRDPKGDVILNIQGALRAPVVSNL